MEDNDNRTNYAKGASDLAVKVQLFFQDKRRQHGTNTDKTLHYPRRE
jgi:hypothetical protein